jgi:uncharacterized protein YkwD
MSGVGKLLSVPVIAAMSLLLLGCGVPIPPAEITATAVAEEQAAAGPPASSGISGGANDSTLTLRTASNAGNAQPIPTLEQPAATPTATPEPAGATPEPTAETAGDTGGPGPGPETGTATPEDTAAEATPEVTAEASGTQPAAASETPAEQATPTATPEPTSTPQPVVANVDGSFVTEFLSLLNAQRTGRGLPALAFDATLAGGATEYAGYMGTDGFFGHYAPDGSSPESRVNASGYAGAYNGEALAAGQWTPQGALNALLASAPHAAILLDPRSVEVGVGYALVEGSRYRHYWVVWTGIP